MRFSCLTAAGPKDVVFITAPFTNSAIPLMAPAALKPIVIQAGFSCHATDLNAEIYNLVKQHPLQQDIISFFLKTR